MHDERSNRDLEQGTSDETPNTSPAELRLENETAEPRVAMSHPHVVRPDILTVLADDEDDGTTL